MPRNLTKKYRYVTIITADPNFINHADKRLKFVTAKPPKVFAGVLGLELPPSYNDFIWYATCNVYRENITGLAYKAMRKHSPSKRYPRERVYSSRLDNHAAGFNKE